MSDARDAASRRLVARLLARAGIDAGTAPDQRSWARFFEATRSLLADLEKDRYLLEQSLDASSQEMLSLNDELRAAATRLVVEREELSRANSLLGATLESTADGILVTDGAGRITNTNGRFVEMWGLPDKVVESGDDNLALAFFLQQLREPDAFLAKVAEVYGDPDACSHDTLELRDGRSIERDSLPQRVDGTVVGRVWSFRDVSEHLRLQHELSHRAFHDHLTDLANRALLGDHIEQALRRRARLGGQVAVVVVDLDGFKNVNDSLGHIAGDALLVAVANRFRSTLRDFDTIARINQRQRRDRRRRRPQHSRRLAWQRRRRHVPRKAGRQKVLPDVRVVDARCGYGPNGPRAGSPKRGDGRSDHRSQPAGGRDQYRSGGVLRSAGTMAHTCARQRRARRVHPTGRRDRPHP